MNEFTAFRTIGATAIQQRVDPGALRQYLRAHTAEVHGRLDARFGDFSGSQIIQSYHRFIRMNLLAHHGVAAFFEIVGAAETVPDAAEAALKQAIETGLNHLEDDCAAMQLDCPPARGFALAPCGTSEMAGLAYVLEGSRLGARFIYRRLEKSGLVGKHEGEVSSSYLRSTFDGEDRETGAFDIIGGMEEAVIEEQALRAALATFALFERSLDRVVAHEGGKEPVQ